MKKNAGGQRSLHHLNIDPAQSLCHCVVRSVLLLSLSEAAESLSGSGGGGGGWGGGGGPRTH